MRASLRALQFRRLYVLPLISNFLEEFLEIKAHLLVGDRTTESRQRSYRGAYPRRAAEQRCPKLGICRHQSIKREAPIETARIGKNPGHRACKSRRVVAPGDVWLADHDREGALSEKGDRTRCVMPHLGFKPESSLPEFFRRDLRCSLGRPADNGCDAAAIFEQTALVLRLEAHVGETGEMQHRPEAIVAVREVMARDRGAQGRVEAAEDHIKASGEDIRLIVVQSNLLPAPLQIRAFSVCIYCSWSHRRSLTQSIDR